MDEDRIALWRRNGQLIRENARMRKVVEAAELWTDIDPAASPSAAEEAETALINAILDYRDNKEAR